MAHVITAVYDCGTKVINFPEGHNFCEVAENVIECRECGATIEQKSGYQLYTPGNGICDV